MHEMSLIQNLLKILEKEIKSPEIKLVKNVRVEIGELRHIVPELLKFSFKHASKSDKLKGAKLKVKVLPIKIKCLKCGFESRIRDSLFACKKCKTGEVKIVSGEEFMLKGVEW
ncbi:MAG: hydrogenase maturation nickel metallochaperone HypA [Candidatus Omnitrophica bacterium]|nr:hydrogenase maturation nickel metallochaperone HypA [Candidatus Omnitrophota bacterium]